MNITKINSYLPLSLNVKFIKLSPIFSLSYLIKSCTAMYFANKCNLKKVYRQIQPICLRTSIYTQSLSSMLVSFLTSKHHAFTHAYIFVPFVCLSALLPRVNIQFRSLDQSYSTCKIFRQFSKRYDNDIDGRLYRWRWIMFSN